MNTDKEHQHDILQNFSTNERFSINMLLKDQFGSRAAKHAPGTDDPLTAIEVDYNDFNTKKKTRMEATLASLKLRRRTKFHAIPVKRTQSQLSMQQQFPQIAIESAEVVTSPNAQVKALPVPVTANSQNSQIGTNRSLDTQQMNKEEKFDAFKKKMAKLMDD